MASTRELLEARSFERHRVLGALHGRGPLEPTGWGVAPVVVSVVLALVVAVGAVLVGRVAPGPPAGWDRGAIVVAQAGGARYVAVDGVLHPVANITSARLAVAASGSVQVLVVEDAVLDRVPRGAALGIVGAPDELPAPGALAQSGWSACLVGGVVHVTLRGAPTELPAAAPAAPPGFVAAHPNGPSLVAGGRRYLIPPETEANTLRALGLDRRRLAQAPLPWLELFPAGAELRVRFPEPLGATLPSRGAAGPATRVGQLIRNASTGNSPAVLTADGLVPVTEFAAAVYGAAAPAGLGQPIVVTSVDLASVPPAPDVLVGDPSWPAELPTPVDPAQTCAVLRAPAGAVSSTRMVRAEHVRPRTAVPGAALALVTVVGEKSASAYVVDGEGRRFEVPAGSGQVLARLGYGDVVPRPIPRAWLALLAAGPALTEAAARRHLG